MVESAMDAVLLAVARGATFSLRMGRGGVPLGLLMDWDWLVADGLR
jgi:hypothetical protein